MTDISCDDLAREVLNQCIAGAPPERLPRTLVEDACAKALFGILVEGLSDRFEPALCDCYARLISQVIAGEDLAAAVRNWGVTQPRCALKWVGGKHLEILTRPGEYDFGVGEALRGRGVRRHRAGAAGAGRER